MPGRRLLALSLAAAALIGGWVYQAPARATYALGVDEALALSGDPGERWLRVSGYLERGSLSRKAPCGARFRIRRAPEGAAAALPVELEGCLPAVLCDLPGVDSEVTIEGRLLREGSARVFRASALIAKCAAKYVVPDVRAACARASAEERALCPYCGHALQEAPGGVLPK